ncbi:DUF983 domain-containing protein [Flavobacterium sp. KJJ]|uniref:DUF983 domain-containing protein n=1 Tax=Flavobacterium sp. KJJ TaxID=1270193 RepID=UPI000AB14A70|nr:DUF983 domain-containing protein [Flavobacterium sp. KJJ]
MKETTKLYNIFLLKCPRCYKGNLFTNPGLFVFKSILKMPERCPQCNQDFRIEPGFYSAALWISYPIVLILFVPMIFVGLILKEAYTISLGMALGFFIIICFGL